MKPQKPRPWLRNSLALGMGALLLLACAQIVGIEDRTYSKDALKEVIEYSEMCLEYCDTVEEACPLLYASRDNCLGTCSLWPEGDINEPRSEPNSVACRLNQARLADSSGSEKEDVCQAAGPGGNGVCGDNCENFCMMTREVCPMNPVPTDCEEKCEAFGDSGTFDAPGDDHEGDTVQCRLVHMSTSAAKTSTPELIETHCGHANWHATDWCYQYDQVASCEHYCRVVRVACEGDNAVYENDEQCMATCEALDKGTKESWNDDTGDHIACRTWHAVTSLISEPEKHCAHAGPTGDGHCGLDTAPTEQMPDVKITFAACRPYCRLLEAACAGQFAEAWGDQEACVAECDASDESFGAAKDQGYSVASTEETGDTLGCRTLHAVRAFEESSNCAAAFGAAPCN